MKIRSCQVVFFVVGVRIGLRNLLRGEGQALALRYMRDLLRGEGRALALRYWGRLGHGVRPGPLALPVILGCVPDE